jgi:Flp pilus assembly pilin Flp
MPNRHLAPYSKQKLSGIEVTALSRFRSFLAIDGSVTHVKECPALRAGHELPRKERASNGYRRHSASSFPTKEGQGTMTSLIVRLATWLQTPPDDKTEGQGLVEYAMLLMLVALVCVGAVTALGTTMKTVFWDAILNQLIPAMGG